MRPVIQRTIDDVMKTFHPHSNVITSITEATFIESSLTNATCIKQLADIFYCSFHCYLLSLFINIREKHTSTMLQRNDGRYVACHLILNANRKCTDFYYRYKITLAYPPTCYCCRLATAAPAATIRRIELREMKIHRYYYDYCEMHTNCNYNDSCSFGRSIGRSMG